MPEITAYHECGHAVIALLLGAEIRQMTIEPANDDGPARSGDAEVSWTHTRFTQREIAHRMIQVCVAGPLAEMIYQDEPFDPEWFVANSTEWSGDFDTAWQMSELLHADRARRVAHIMQQAQSIYRLLNTSHIWNAVQTLADNLLAHETLESEEIEEIVSYWLERS